LIVSHKYRYIFIKPYKVAGTSIEVALAEHCGESDIVTPVTKYSEKFDAEEYVHEPRNYEGFRNHMLPKDIKAKVGDTIWKDYYKFTVVRNPWDQLISRYYWEREFSWFKIRRNIVNILSHPFRLKLYLNLLGKLKMRINLSSFKLFIINLKQSWLNTNFYFDENGEKVCDYYIRYEHLEEDFRSVCKLLGFSDIHLPKLKSKTRKHKHSVNYTDKQYKKVFNMCRLEIERFNYK